MTSRLRSEVSADLHRVLGRSSIAQVVWSAATRRCYRPMVTLRLCQACERQLPWLLPPLVLLHRAARHWAGLDLPWNTRIAAGLRIDHGWGLVINSHAVIGHNVTLFHGVTLGQSDRIGENGTRSTRYPVIEDDVWIGPHAVVAGVRIGRGSRIGGGAFVTKDVPAGSLVIGNPAHVVHEAVAADVQFPWPPTTD